MPAVALTDQANLFALVKFYKTAQSKGIKPIVGVDALVRDDGRASEPSRLVLLCQDSRGYLNLTRLVTRSYLEGQGGAARRCSAPGSTRRRRRGLIALSGAREGDVGRALLAQPRTEARAPARSWLEPVRRPLLPRAAAHRAARRGGAASRGRWSWRVTHGVPVVATNDVRFLGRDDFEAHEARVCIHEGTLLDDPRRPRRYSEEQYLRSPEEMAGCSPTCPRRSRTRSRSPRAATWS